MGVVVAVLASSIVAAIFSRLTRDKKLRRALRAYAATSAIPLASASVVSELQQFALFFAAAAAIVAFIYIARR